MKLNNKNHRHHHHHYSGYFVALKMNVLLLQWHFIDSIVKIIKEEIVNLLNLSDVYFKFRT